MKIYTKTGDKGTTGLWGGKRVSKADLKIESYGTVDELNSHIGNLLCFPVLEDYKPALREIQDRLFTIGSWLAADPEKAGLKKPDLLETDITFLENAMDEMDAQLPELRAFVLPGSDSANAAAHMARTVCRRAERCVVRLTESDPQPEILVTYLNRLSDYLFVLSRICTLKTNSEEIAWRPRK